MKDRRDKSRGIVTDVCCASILCVPYDDFVHQNNFLVRGEKSH
jgi:hypothetical protein